MNGLNVLLTMLAIGCYALAAYTHKKHAQSFYGSLIGGLAAVLMCLLIVANVSDCADKHDKQSAAWVRG